MVLKEVPVVDVSPSLKGDGDKSVVSKSVDHACSEIGFLIVTGHQVQPRLIEETRSISRRFFALPFQTKLRYSVPPRGYKALGATAFSYTLGVKTPPDVREAYSVGPCGLPDDEYYRKGGDHFVPNVWPPEVPELQGTLCGYFRVMQDLGMELTRICALALGLPERFFDDKFDRPAATMVVNYYPPQTEKPLPGQLRGGAHTDYGGITILQRDDSPGGLQVQTKDGEWVKVPYVPDSFVINIGDLMARWTNDRWVSTLHRVENPPWERARSLDRMSIAFFFDPNYDVVIEPLKTCCGPDNPPRYEAITAGEHKLMKLRKTRLVSSDKSQ